jgi:hypothetical protein
MKTLTAMWLEKVGCAPRVTLPGKEGGTSSHSMYMCRILGKCQDIGEVQRRSEVMHELSVARVSESRDVDSICRCARRAATGMQKMSRARGEGTRQAYMRILHGDGT